jgi:hypothetical protein
VNGLVLEPRDLRGSVEVDAKRFAARQFPSYRNRRVAASFTGAFTHEHEPPGTEVLGHRDRYIGQRHLLADGRSRWRAGRAGVRKGGPDFPQATVLVAECSVGQRRRWRGGGRRKRSPRIPQQAGRSVTKNAGPVTAIATGSVPHRSGAREQLPELVVAVAVPAVRYGREPAFSNLALKHEPPPDQLVV